MKAKSVSKFRGLNLQSNSFGTDYSYLEKAENVVIRYDDRIQKRRGFATYNTLNANKTAKAIIDFDNNILVFAADCIYRFDTNTTTFTGTCSSSSTTVSVTLSTHGLLTDDNIADITCSTKAFKEKFPNQEYDYSGIRVVTRVNANQFTFVADEQATGSGSGTFTARFVKKLGGATISLSSYYPYFARTNKNLYFVTDNGIHKLTSSSADVIKAGIPQGLDLQGTFSGYDSGVIRADSKISYRVTFYTKDANGNLIIGAPSEQLLLTNNTITPSAILGPDYPITLITKSGTSMILDAAGANTLVAINDLIDVYNSSHSANNGTFLVTNVTATQVTVTNGAAITDNTPPVTCKMVHNKAQLTSNDHGLTNGDIVQIFHAVTTGGTIADGTSFSIDSTVTTNTFQLTFSDRSITAITSLDFGYARTATLYFSVPAEIFTTSYGYEIYRTTPSGHEEDLPIGDYKLVTSALFTSTDIARGFILFVDTIPGEILGKELYTNNNTQEGELQANNRPPLATDITTYKNYTFYFNTKNYAYLDLAVVVPSNVVDGTTVTIGSTVFKLVEEAANTKVGNALTDATIAVVSTTATVTFNGHGLSNSDVITLVSNTQSIPNQSYTISNVATNTFDFTIASGSGSGTCKFEALKNASNQYYVKSWVDTTDVTVAESIDFTARAFVKAINRSAAYYAEYTSQYDGTPGLLRIEAINFGTSFSVVTSNATTGTAFYPNIPTAGTTVSSSQDEFKNRLYFSKLSEPEAVPRLNYISVGSESATGYRIIALRDSVIVMKEDGVFRVTGDSPNNFTAIVLDATATIKAAKSAVLLNNSVFMLSDQGVCSITESAVRIVSRSIEPLLSAVVGNSTLAANTAAVGYESDRYYIISTLDELANRTTYAYNFVTDSWTTSTKYFDSAIVSLFDDKVYMLNTDGKTIYRENKLQYRTDLTDNYYYVPVKTFIRANAITNIGTSSVTVTTSFEHGLKVGDILTIRDIDASIAAVFTASTDPLYRRAVTQVKSLTQFVFAADSNATLTIDGFIDFQEHISEIPVSIVIANSSSTATITFPNAHGLVNGDAIRVHNITAALIAGLSAETDLTGYRVVSVVDSVTVTIKLTAAATGNVTSTGKVSDYNDKHFITVISSNVAPEKGDLLSDSNSTIFKFTDVTVYATSTYIVKLHDNFTFLESDRLALRGRIVSKIDFSQISFTGQLHTFADFIVHVRGVHDCTYLNMNFACDSSNSSTITAWSSGVGSKKQVDDFSGFGRVTWGTYPWGGGTTRTLEYTTRAGAQVRTWVPKTSAYGTFLKPKLEHVFGGEQIDLSVVQVYANPISERVLK